jgi:hypothetical protein
MRVDCVSRGPDFQSDSTFLRGGNPLPRYNFNVELVVLRVEDEEQWLGASRTPVAKAQSLLRPLPAELMDAHDVSTIVNSAKYDGPECIKPVSDYDRPRAGQLFLL